jgi:putative endonuclease
MAWQQRYYFVYIMTNRSKTLYTGVTNGLVRRVYEHKTMLNDGFTSRYKIDRLAYYERHTSVDTALAREKQIKGWRRIRKIELIVSMNPTWADLAAGWYTFRGPQKPSERDSTE